MKSNRAPDRVHVVRPPAQDDYIAPTQPNKEIIRMLAQISDKLKRSEAERYELLSELREYRKQLRELEDKNQGTQKTCTALETELKSRSAITTESTQRQLRVEKSLKEAEEKLLQTIANQALINERLRETEDKHEAIDQRLDESVAEQARMSRQQELMTQDKSLLQRKIERLEEMVAETQESLRAKTMNLLSDQNAPQKAAALQAPSWGTGSPVIDPGLSDQDEDDAQQPASFLNKNNGIMLGVACLALLAGWGISQTQKPPMPVIPTEQATLSQPPVIQESPTAQNEQTVNDTVIDAQTATMVEDTPKSVLDYNDDQLRAEFDQDPDQLAAKLNDIEPAKAVEIVETQTPQESTEPKEQAQAPDQNADTSKTNEPLTASQTILPNFDTVAFAQRADVTRSILSQKSSRPLKEQMAPDTNLSAPLQSIEQEAYRGNAEAQHDLAAIYTAGQGTSQNFERARFWFRQASDNGIANARYNLGVLNHQGLGTTQNIDKAIYWYREAAKLNHAEAQYNLGIAHIEGIGTDYDPRLAAAFFEKAANNGVMEAAYNLGLIFENGLLGDVQPHEALLWYKIAADQGSPDARQAMEQLAKNLQIGMDDVDRLVDRMQEINQSTYGRKAGPSGDNIHSNTINHDQATIAQIQEYLMLTGYYTGPADGINGPRTENAIRNYQAENGLAADGQISKTLLKQMVGRS